MSELDHLISTEFGETKQCGYPGCPNKILASSEFPYCEVCRALALRNSISILLDPTAPINDRQEMIFSRAVHLMRPDEILNGLRKIEWIYLELSKQLKSHQLETYRKKQMEDGFALANTERAKPKAPRAAAKREAKSKDKRNALEKTFGREAARKLLEDTDQNEDLGF